MSKLVKMFQKGIFTVSGTSYYSNAVDYGILEVFWLKSSFHHMRDLSHGEIEIKLCFSKDRNRFENMFSRSIDYIKAILRII